MKYEKKSMDINLEQQKLITNPLRVKIIYLLCEKPMTAKQVADYLAKTAGSIHYHVQQLYNGGILELVETKENKGIIEKYYKSKASHFRLVDNIAVSASSKVDKVSTILSLTEQELEDFKDDLGQLIVKYFQRTVNHKENRTAYEIECIFNLLENEED